MSSNKKWPSLFKSKPSTSHYHHDNPSYLHNSNCNISSSISPDRVPDTRPRWNPKPEQVQILESIFNSGMVNPSRDEIHRIRIRLEAYGQLGDANVFYWFQNRKSRAKQKLRHLPKKSKSSKKDKIVNSYNDAVSSFDLVNPNLCSGQNNEFPVTEPLGFQFPVLNDLGTAQLEFDLSDFVTPVVTEEELSLPTVSNNLNALNKSVNIDNIPESNFYDGNSYGGENWYFPNWVPGSVPSTSQFQGEQDVVSSSGGVVGDCVPPMSLSSGEVVRDFVPPMSLSSGEVVGDCVPPMSLSSGEVVGDFVPPMSLSSGEVVGDCVPPMSLTVFINDLPYQVVAGLFNVKEAFGNNAILINSFGQPVLTDESGLTFQPLQNGGVYYLI